MLTFHVYRRNWKRARVFDNGGGEKWRVVTLDVNKNAYRLHPRRLSRRRTNNPEGKSDSRTGDEWEGIKGL